jgi:hypothetical protein
MTSNTATRLHCRSVSAPKRHGAEPRHASSGLALSIRYYGRHTAASCRDLSPCNRAPDVPARELTEARRGIHLFVNWY